MRKFIKRNRFVFLTMTFLCAYFFYNYHITSAKMDELRATRASLETEIGTLEDEVARLKDAYDYVQTEEAIERQAREKLKMVKSNEIIYYIRDSGVPEEEEKNNEKSNP